jgi:TolB-like protein/predicted Zn-dependent protease
MGTVPYMAPEQLRGEPVDARSDIWALGVVLYEMASGARPFQGNTGFELSSEILTRSPRPLPAQVPAAMGAVIERCLEKEPGRRYQRAGEVRAALEALQTGTVSPLAGRRPLIGRRRWLIAAAAVALVTLLAAGLDFGGVRRRLLEGTGAPDIDSLVVLPLTNLSGDPGQDFFADGMTEALIAELSQIEGLDVVSRTSATQYKGTTKSLPEIVGELGVDGVIEGGVLREGDQVRVTIKLVSGRSDKTLWAQSFDRESAGILALYSEVVRAIASEVQVTLSPQHEEALLARTRSVDPEAYEAYLKGLMYWYKQTPLDVDRALQYFQFAQEKDADFALAHLGMLYVWTYYASTGLAPAGEMRASVQEAVRKVREIDPTLAEAHEVEADFFFYYDWDWEAAEKSYRRAIELKPKSAEMRFYYLDFLIAMNRIPEAREQIERSVELDPFNSYVQLVYGLFLSSAHRFDEAVGQLHEVLEAEEDFGPAHLGLWQAYHHKGMHEEALASVREYFSKWGDDEMVSILDAGFAEGGYQQAMRRAAQERIRRSEQQTVLAIHVAQMFAYAGDEQRALDWLEKAHEARETGLVKLQVDPDWDGLRDEPRFQDLLRRMDFPPA